MKYFYPKISYCIPVYNEEDIVVENLRKIEKDLIEILGNKRFEMIIVENGSTDSTFKILKTLKSKNIKAYSVKEKGIGKAFRLAINKANYNYLLLTAIDLPFSFSDLNNIRNEWKDYDLIFGSKAHKNSRINTFFKRKLYSFFYRIFIKVLFNLKINDTQGSIFLNRKKTYPILKYCNSNNAFFTTQLAIWGSYKGLKTAEVPVIMKKQTERKSKYSLIKDGGKMALNLIQEFYRLKSEKI